MVASQHMHKIITCQRSLYNREYFVLSVRSNITKNITFNMLYLNQSEKKMVGTVTVRTNENVHVNSIRAAKL